MGNPTEHKAAAPVAPSTASTVQLGAILQPVGRPQCQYGDKCNRKNPDHKTEFSHPGDSDYTSTGSAHLVSTPDGYQPARVATAPYPTGTGDGETAEDRGFLGAVGGAAAGYGGMKVTGLDEQLGFFGQAAVVVGAAIAGSKTEDYMRSDDKKGKKGKKDKKEKKGKKDKKDKKSKSRELEVGERGLPGEGSESDSSSSGDELSEQRAMENPSVPTCVPSVPSVLVPSRPACKYGEKCFRGNLDHKKDFSHPGDSDWVVLSDEAALPSSSAVTGHLLYTRALPS